MAHTWTCGLCHVFFGVREEFLHPTFIHLNLVTASNRFREQCSLKDLELKCREIHNCTATHNQYHISLICRLFLQRKRLSIDLISGGAKRRLLPLNTRQSEAVTVSLFFVSSALHHPCLWAFCTLLSFACIKRPRW